MGLNTQRLIEAEYHRTDLQLQQMTYRMHMMEEAMLLKQISLCELQMWLLTHEITLSAGRKRKSEQLQAVVQAKNLFPHIRHNPLSKSGATATPRQPFPSDIPAPVPRGEVDGPSQL